MVNLSILLRLFNQIPALRALSDSLATGTPVTQPLRVPVSARLPLVAMLHHQLQTPVLLITGRADRARILTDQLRFWADNPAQVYRFPDPAVLPYERIPWNRDTIARRMAALTALATANPAAPPIIVTSARALMQKTMPPAWLTQSLRTYRVGQQIDMAATLREWLDLGYENRGVVEEPGEFSRRGGIMDIFPPDSLHPVRIDLFGDEIDSIRMFNPISQRSEQRLTEITIAPAIEAMPRYAQKAAAALKKLDRRTLQPVAANDFQELHTMLAAGTGFHGIENLLPLMCADPATILDFLPADGLVIIENPAELEAVVNDLQAQAENLKTDMVNRYTLPPDMPAPYFNWQFLVNALKARMPLTLGFDDWADRADLPPAADVSVAGVFVSPPVFGGQIKPAIEELLRRKKTGERVVITSRQAARLSDFLANENIIAPPLDTLDVPPPSGSITIFNRSVLEGWLLRPREGSAPVLSLFTDAELFGDRKPQPRRRPRRQKGITPETFFADVRPGDYVVHIEYGIGIFRGLVKLDLDGIEREYLQVDYSQNDILYVPIHQSDRLSRYVGVDDAPPKINRLGTADWARVKKRARTAVAEIADELLRIYAARKVVPGRAFSPDTEWQRELEASFPYVETEDQLHALADVKADMEKPRPMDRLICGDVGYGKTEVALRAAFKAVMDGAQVAILVPTTVLAQQHFATFRSRLAAYPVTVEMLSRFRTRRETDEVLRGLASGKVDIVIGTHRLLQKDVVFKNLGLLVVDEEQRFGVAHKERLKEMRVNVDTLTLTATPIPRTLHMSLTGVRDMSVIETPPEERLPIKTTVATADDTLIRTAILREIDRGGQVYFVHNRVLGIEAMAQRIRKLVPEARVVIGHGQMSERKLEKVMLDFAAGDYDVLVSTTIIESGLDIPNVNTIIINRADRFGLAQLYQLRGRVGRAAVQSYAYLLVPKNYKLPEVARKRLEAIQEASELGAGFKIAMRDLEIRGAGDLLGAKQHGHIAAVGFDLYTRLLAQAVQALQGDEHEGITERFDETYLMPLEEDIQINLPLPVFLPEDYLPEEHLRLKLYRRMGNLSTMEEIDAMGQELEDRFGQLPEPVLNLLYQIRMKVLCRAAGVKALATESGNIVIRADVLEDVDRQILDKRLGMVARVERRQIVMPLRGEPEQWQAELENVLVQLGRVVNDPG